MSAHRIVISSIRLTLTVMALSPFAMTAADTKPVTASIATAHAMGLSQETLSAKSVQSIDGIMEDFRAKIGCSAATIAIGKDDRLIFAKGYGSLDTAGKQPATADAIIGIASCEKPVTAAAARQLFRKKGRSLDTRLVSLIKPPTPPTDARVTHITVNHLLEHKIGMPDDHSLGYRGAGKRFSQAITEFYAAGLKEEPGKTYAYSNFSYDILRHLVPEISRIDFADYYNQQLLPAKSLDFTNTEAATPNANANLVHNVAEGGPVAASAISLCRFMERFWLSGLPRDKSNQTWSMNGSLPGSTTLMRWLPDGHNVVIIFNGRAKSVDHADIDKKLLPEIAYTRRTRKTAW